MAEPYHSNIRHFLIPTTGWQCVLCREQIAPEHAREHHKRCVVERRIREIIRDELAQQIRAPYSTSEHING